ncbi:BnaCnng26170D [Brassica napus]|uniref:BnaCnng26170D protein n=1 Tax=Brassica napus TaxID=3708 RepID=A0A078IXQ4_BRANA|nr:BnaCnng26170D [Brassica napus]
MYAMNPIITEPKSQHQPGIKLGSVLWQGLLAFFLDPYSDSHLLQSLTPNLTHLREGVSHREYDHHSGEFTQLGFGKSPPLNVNEAESGEIRNPRFISFDEINELTEEDDEESLDEWDHGDDLAVLESFGKIPHSRQDVNRSFDVEEDESRHPLVRETNRLINLRSSWNPKHKGEMRNLRRSLKPSQVCAVLRSQDDERVALKFFYWADRQWRYRHHPVVYYSMLEVLSKTKLCQGARRVLVLMKRRGIHRTSKAFSLVMVSYSRAGQLRDALKVLTLMQRAGVEPDLLVCKLQHGYWRSVVLKAL